MTDVSGQIRSEAQKISQFWLVLVNYFFEDFPTEINKLLLERTKQGRHSQGEYSSSSSEFSPYSKSHGYKRKKEGKPINPKTLIFSGEMWESHDAITSSRYFDDNMARFTMSFSDSVNNKWGLPNKTIAERLTDQEATQINALNDQEIKLLQEKLSQKAAEIRLSIFGQ